jgi:NAD dependent epimerase/dehydratase family enzyme
MKGPNQRRTAIITGSGRQGDTDASKPLKREAHQIMQLFRNEQKNAHKQEQDQLSLTVQQSNQNSNSVMVNLRANKPSP